MEGATPIDERDEVRVALVLNGGVSLAVWIGGVAAELDAARRAGCQPALDEAGVVYERLSEAFGCRLVIDIMSGSSAGGINGALLGAAMARGSLLTADFMRDRWTDLADFSSLLQPLSTAKPPSVMQGKKLEEGLASAFRTLCKRDPSAPPPFVPALDITTSDLHGRTVSAVDDWGERLEAAEHRVRFAFRCTADYTAAQLTDAGRATASFPIAFEPACVDKAAGLGGVRQRTWAVDGGLLDNAPIQAALELIPSRPVRSTRGGIRRYLCYVNGDPTHGPDETAPDGQPPGPLAVGGALIGLPRTAPLADHVKAIRALRRRPATLAAELNLLELDPPALARTADGLFDTYCQRRRWRSLSELTDDEELAHSLEQLPLPWIPPRIATTDADTWRWGVTAARRVHHLMLDVLRASLSAGVAGDRAALLHARAAVSAQATACAGTEAVFVDSYRRALRSCGPEPDDPTARGIAASDRLAAIGAPDGVIAGLRHTYEAMRAVRGRLRVPEGRRLRLHGLLRGVGERGFRTFLTRVTLIEVVRRTFDDETIIDDGQTITFAQITPAAPMVVLRDACGKPRDADAKLCGVVLAHFGGFYRASWRVNDFMWGRLDGAARIVGMLIPPKETVSDAGRARAAAVLEPLLAHPPGGGETLTRAEIEHDLNGDGLRTREACTRVVQRAILGQELGPLLSAADAELADGATAHTLGYTADAVEHDLEAVIAGLETGPTLPERLGRDSAREHTSDLAVRTISRAALAGIGVTSATGLPFTPLLRTLQSVLLPALAVVAIRVRYRVGVLLAFWAAALVVALRVTTIPTTGPALPSDRLSALNKTDVLVAVVAVFVVAGVALVPFLRALRPGRVRVHRRDRTDYARMARQGLWAAALLASGGGAALVVGGLELGWSGLLVAGGAEHLPKLLTAGVLALGAGSVVTLPVIRRSVESFAAAPWRRGSLALTVVVAVAVAGWSAVELLDRFELTRFGWRDICTAVALVVAPLIAGIFLLGRRPAARLRRDLVAQRT